MNIDMTRELQDKFPFVPGLPFSLPCLAPEAEILGTKHSAPSQLTSLPSCLSSQHLQSVSNGCCNPRVLNNTCGEEKVVCLWKMEG